MSILLICVNNLLDAQTTFQKIYGDTLTTMSVSKPTSDGGSVLLVYEQYNHNNVLIRLNSFGDTSWIKRYGVNHSVPLDIEVSTDGGYIMSAGKYDIQTDTVYIMKTDSTGNLLWSNLYGMGGFASATGGGTTIQKTSNGGCIVATTLDSSIGISTRDFGLIKINSAGNVTWAKRIHTPYNDFPECITQTSDGGYVLVGSSGSYGAAPSEGYMVKVDSLGNLLWNKAFVSPSLDVIQSVEATMDGGVVFPFLGYFIKVNANGNIAWIKSLSVSGSRRASCIHIVQTPDTGYVITGNMVDTLTARKCIFVSKVDQNGNIVWSKSYDNNNFNLSDAVSVRMTADGGYQVCGSILLTGLLNNLTYLIKTDANGNTSCGGVNESMSFSNGNLTETTYPTYVSSYTPLQTPLNTNVDNQVIKLGNACALGINEQFIKSSIAIYPNPFTTEFTITPTSSNGELAFLDMSGKEIYRQKAKEGNTTMNTSLLIPGFYILRYNEKNRIANFKLIKY